MATKKMTAEQKALYKQFSKAEKKYCDSLTDFQRDYFFIRVGKVYKMRPKIKDEIYPIVLDASESIDDAKTFTAIIENVINQEFNNQKQTMRVQDLDIHSKLDPKAPNYNEYKMLLNLLAKETIADALEMISGFPKYIDNVILEETKKRKFKDLVINWEKA